ncbi:hypothetical protein KY284_021510 [Solanum tuberosum]|nr:hypothetical protein KY284_021510 [Solanum tuberosum]
MDTFFDNKGNPQPPPFGCAQANMDGYLVFNEKLTAANNSKKYVIIPGKLDCEELTSVRGIVEVCTRYSMNAIVGKNADNFGFLIDNSLGDIVKSRWMAA